MNFGAVIGRKTRLFGLLGSLKKQMFEVAANTYQIMTSTRTLRNCSISKCIVFLCQFVLCRVDSRTSPLSRC